MLPLVSIIIPCFNDGAYLREAVASAQAQTYAAYEIIVVDDHSNDPHTCTVLNALKSEGIAVISTPNGKKGPSAARNTGITHAQGKYILPLDADDKIAPAYLERACACMESDPGIRICTCRFEHFGLKHGLMTSAQGITMWGIISLQAQIISSSMFRRCDWEAVGGYSESMTHHEDRTFWVSLLELGGRVHEIDEALFFYRIRAGSLCTQFASEGFSEVAATAFFDANTRIFERYTKNLFLEYQKMLAQHAQRNTSYIYKLVKPLMALEWSLRQWVKRLMGRA